MKNTVKLKGNNCFAFKRNEQRYYSTTMQSLDMIKTCKDTQNLKFLPVLEHCDAKVMARPRSRPLHSSVGTTVVQFESYCSLKMTAFIVLKQLQH